MKRADKYLESKPTAVLILADFSDGSWHAISFAMQFLYSPNSKLFILQTFQSPKFGIFMTRNILPQLKKITTYELNTLKTKLLANYNIENEHIELLSFKGELANVLQNKLDLKYSYNIVIGTYSSFANSSTMQNLCLTKVLNCSKNALFILPKKFKQKESRKILFVGNSHKVPSTQIKNQILKICKKSNSELDILVVVKEESQQMQMDVQHFFENYFKDVNYEINFVKNKSVCSGMKSFVKNDCKDLIIVERN